MGKDSIYEKLKDKAAFTLSKGKLKSVLTSDNIDVVLNSIKQYKGKGFYDKIRLAQEYDELKDLCIRVQNHKPKVIAEIGTWNGGTFYVWTRINPQAKKIISIDLPDGDYGGGYDEKRIKFFSEFSSDRENTSLSFIRGDSKSDSTVEMLKAVLGKDTIDFLYIDGDHTYEGIKKDFENYVRLMSADGLVGFHDINTFKDGYGVHKYWNEIKGNYKYEEFIKPGSRVMGNGLIYLRED
ncbi:MAG: class I SAM-dependent methyltransferase [Ignavibacteria bacterium]|nr:class I SAM-dependent methyltransferase [Ignavibacteria bacterium]